MILPILFRKCRNLSNYNLHQSPSPRQLAAAASFSPHLLFHRRCSLVSSSPSPSQTQDPTLTESSNNSIADFLISSCGFSSPKAATASKFIRKSTSVEQAKSVRHFFKHHLGCTDDNIRKLITNGPQIISSDVDRTLQPNLQSLCAMGFKASELETLIASNPRILVNAKLAIPRLKYWQTFLGTNNHKDLVALFHRNRGLIGCDIDSGSGIGLKITLLKECGLSDADIIGLVRRGCGLIQRSPKAIEALLKRAKGLGFNPKSPMFGRVLSLLSCIGSASLEAKMELLKDDFGWSHKEVLAAFRKAPFVFSLSKEKIREKMEFLLGRGGLQHSYIASNPVFLSYSLDKRLRPRLYVLEILKKSMGIAGERAICSILVISENKFVETVILPNKKQVPNIHEVYIAACAGDIPI